MLPDPEEEPSLCADIPDGACVAVPRSFALNAASGGCSKLAEQLAGPGVVLTLLLDAVGAPVAFAGALEPLRRGLATLPQLALAPVVRAAPRRTRVWATAAYGQAAALVALVLGAAWTSGAVAGAVVLACVAVFSVLSGLASSAFSDVVGKTVPRPVRGRLLAVRSGAGGLATVSVGAALGGTLGGADRWTYLALVAAAAALWALSGALFGAIPEPPGATEGGGSPLRSARRGIGAMRRDAWFAWFTAVRILLVAVELAVPYFTLAARDSSTGGTVGFLILAAGLGQVLGGPLWGRITDRVSARRTFLLAGSVAVVAVGLTLASVEVGVGVLAPYAAGVLLATVARTGVRIARKTYLVNAAPADDRSLYTAASNSVTGVAMLAFAAVGVLAQSAGVAAALYAVGVCTLLGMALATRLPTAAQVR